ncbi:MAG TPA: DsbE family thiol:disulfide interchange protein [Gammaproteobacteria bacterium]|nr:DsbE family thiol:disulfide interchange protein [Gammaproteobacteria bacterium]
MLRYLIPLGIFALLVVFLARGLYLDPHQVPSPLIGKPAPDFVLPQVQDATQQIARKDLLGKVTLLNVWASWCVACRQEHPLLVELARTGAVNIYGLNYKDKREDALRWLDQLGNPYLVSAFDETGKVGIDYGVYGVPETYVIDRQGIIRYKLIGPLTEENLRDKILPLVKELQG